MKENQFGGSKILSVDINRIVQKGPACQGFEVLLGFFPLVYKTPQNVTGSKILILTFQFHTVLSWKITSTQIELHFCGSKSIT